MTRRRHIPVLADIVEVRSMQTSAAEAAMVRAGEGLRQLEVHRDCALGELAKDQESWSDAVSAAALDMQMAAVWGAQIVRQEGEVASLAVQIAAAEQTKVAKVAEWRRSLARADAAREMARGARRRLARQRDEAILNELTDMFAHRGRR